MSLTAGIRVVVCLAATSAFAAPGVAGKWRSERQVGDADGKTYAHVSIITLKEADGGALTGSIVATSEAPWMRQMTGKTIAIESGSVEGNKFSFRIVQEAGNGTRTTVYEGTVEGDEMTGIVKFRGIGQTWDLKATRSQ